MLFNSFEYALFFPLVLILYLAIGQISLRAQNALLLVSSYVFYGWWDWRFVGLLALSSTVDFLVGLGLAAQSDGRRRRWLLLTSLAFNFSILGFFKYFNFFVTSASEALTALGFQAHASTLSIILPVGLSFYTFQAITYTVSVYSRKIEAERDPVAFFAYVAFFPQLVAGPIERAGHLLPQFLRPRVLTPAAVSSGIRQIIWGLFCKIVVADNCAVVANAIFNYNSPLSGSVVLTGAFFFAFQIYGDFSGYSHIALGSARILGFELMQNFATPYFSQSIPEFWRRWHISLSTWFRDYVFIPLGGSRVGKFRQVLNILITFTVSGLWHGANWTYVVWGFLNGLYYLPGIFFGSPLTMLRESRVQVLRKIGVGLGVASTFFLTLIAWIFFRSTSMHQASSLIASIPSPSLLENPLRQLKEFSVLTIAGYGLIAIGIMLIFEWIKRDKEYALDLEGSSPWTRWIVYAGVVVCIGTLRYTGSPLSFIYFQF